MEGGANSDSLSSLLALSHDSSSAHTHRICHLQHTTLSFCLATCQLNLVPSKEYDKHREVTVCLTLWRPLLPYGYSYKAVPERDKPSFVIFDIRALWRSGLSVRVPGCQNDCLTTVGVKWRSRGRKSVWRAYRPWRARVPEFRRWSNS